jgi:hypothetical protein
MNKYWAAVVAAGASVASANAASPTADNTYRTATWYADHPAILNQVTAICRDDPGHATHNADCKNAEQGRTIVATRDAISHRNATDLTPPSNPRYWQIHPSEVAFQRAVCSRLPADPAIQQANNCPSLRTFLGMSK